MTGGRRFLLAIFLFSAYGTLTSCTYNVTGPEDPGTLTIVAPDPNLSVSGLDVFEQDIRTATDTCSMANVLLDYRDEAMRRTQLAWQAFEEKNGSSTGSLQFNSLEVKMECVVRQSMFGWYTMYSDPDCTTRMILVATFEQGDAVPVTRTAVRSARGSAFDCSGTQQSAEEAMPDVLGALLYNVFGDYGIQ